MKRSLILLVTLALLLAACSSVVAPGKTGVVTEVNGKTVTVAHADGQSSTYTLTNRTVVYAPDGIASVKAYLSKGQRVMVWVTGPNAVRINIES